MAAHHNHQLKRMTVSLETALFVVFVIFVMAFAIYESARHFHIEAKIERIRAEHRADIERVRAEHRQDIELMEARINAARNESHADIRRVYDLLHTDIQRVEDRVYER